MFRPVVPLLGPLPTDRRLMAFTDLVPGEASGAGHLNGFVFEPGEVISECGELLEDSSQTGFDVVH